MHLLPNVQRSRLRQQCLSLTPRHLIAVEPFVRFHLLCHDVGVFSSFVHGVLNSGSKVYLMRHCSLNHENSNILFFGEKSDIPPVVVVIIEILMIVHENIVYKIVMKIFSQSKNVQKSDTHQPTCRSHPKSAAWTR